MAELAVKIQLPYSIQEIVLLASTHTAYYI
jgi:hypothetical protein